MNINFVFKDFDASEALKEHALQRFEKVKKFFPADEELDVQMILSVEKFRHKAEIVFNADNMHVSAFEISDDMYATIDVVIEKLVNQIRKIREKNKSHRNPSFARMDVLEFADETDKTPRVVESEELAVKPMAVEEAVEQLKVLKEFEFFVFLNRDTERVNVLYRRTKGNFGLIDPQV